MIRQLGILTLFISLSAADTKWTQLLQSIHELIHTKKNYRTGNRKYAMDRKMQTNFKRSRNMFSLF